MSFRDIALPLAVLGIPVTPLRPRSKDAFLPGWQTTCTTDPAKIAEWDALYPDSNVGAVATGEPDGVFFFEIDDPAVLDRIAHDTGHELIDEIHPYMVRSSPGKGHLYFRNNPASIQMGNIPQAYGPWSVRQKNMYVCASGSIHPKSGTPYVCLTPGRTLTTAPDWLIQWLNNERNKERPIPESGAVPQPGKKIPHGFIHPWLVKEAGHLRSLGFSVEKIEHDLLEAAYLNCELPLDDEKIKQVARSTANWEPNAAVAMALNLNQQPDYGAVPQDEVELPTFVDGSFPVFPEYVFANTSLYDNFVKPVCDKNSRIPYFMWVPAMVMLQNYLGTRVQIQTQYHLKPVNMSQYIVLIGERGNSNKSSSVDDAMNFFNYIGCLDHNGGGLKAADGKTIVWTPGSAEGLGLEMQKTNCKNALIFYDELAGLVKKAGIDGSTLSNHLLTLYESKKFGNTVKTKEAFALAPGTYCVSMIACATPETFTDLWSRMNGNDVGLDDRMFFVYQPEELPERRIKIDINFFENAPKTKQLIDRAIQQGIYEVEDWNHPKLQQLVPLGDRFVARAIKWALAIAVDLGLSTIDDESIERGCDIVQYEIKVKKFVKTYDASNREAALQSKMRRTLEMNKGTLPERELMRKCHFEREGTSMWNQAFYGLAKAGIIRVIGKGGKIDPRVVQVLIKMEGEDS
jgi:hypothetical protein